MSQTATSTASETTTQEPKSLPENLIPQPETSPLEANIQNVKKLSFDPEALKKKYIEERDKRLRHNTGIEQYRHVDHNEFASFLNDPFRGDKIERDPIIDSCDVVIIGGGYGGQLIAVRLMEKGITNVRIIEKGGDFGGAW